MEGFREAVLTGLWSVVCPGTCSVGEWGPCFMCRIRSAGLSSGQS